MRLKPRLQYVSSPDLSLTSVIASSLIPATTRNITIPNIGMPLDRLDLIGKFTVSGVGASTNPNFPMGIPEIVKNIRLRRFPRDKAPTTIVDCSGCGLIEYGLNTIGAPDSSTQLSIAVGGNTALAPTARTYFFNIPIPLAHNQLPDGPGVPLRCFTLADIHNDLQAPVLTIETNASTEVFDATGTNSDLLFSAASFELLATYREASVEFENNIKNRGGYLSYDLVETTKYVSTGASTQSVKVPSPGFCTGMLVRTWSNNSTTVGTNARGLPGASRSAWQLKVANSAVRDIVWEDVARVNAESNGQMIYRAAANAVYDTAPIGSYYLDFLTDSLADPSQDFGSVLALPNAVETKIEGPFTGTAVDMKLLLHRIYDDLSPARFSGAVK